MQLALYNDHLIAVKCLSKTKTVVSKQLQNIVYERNAMWTMDNPFILKLLGTSQSQNTLYLLLELVEVACLPSTSALRRCTRALEFF